MDTLQDKPTLEKWNQLAAAGQFLIVTGAYSGKGTYGSNNETVVSFSKTPVAVFISSADYQAFFVRTAAGAVAISTSGSRTGLNVSWVGKQLRWYSTTGAAAQLNTSSQYYAYLAVLENE